ncbi:MAG: bifunctional phosphoribosyl-AMP cyclohydrolase/phosphoribosyl-ATP diphosphatase HisIE [Flavobacterium sp.]
MNIDFSKNPDGLVPAIIQDIRTQKVLMLGYMNQEAFTQTKTTGRVTFYSRTKQRLWTKGEESGNFLKLEHLQLDCDSDTLLIQVTPQGPVCHTGADTCWQQPNDENVAFLNYLETVIQNRIQQQDAAGSYVAKLVSQGINKVAQKVGEEAVELVIEAKDDNRELFLNEGADLLFHFLVLLQAKGFSLQDVIKVLQQREKK